LQSFCVESIVLLSPSVLMEAMPKQRYAMVLHQHGIYRYYVYETDRMISGGIRLIRMIGSCFNYALVSNFGYPKIYDRFYIAHINKVSNMPNNILLVKVI
jgi:hypothetical protein